MPDHQLVDVHAHICDPDFDEDRTDVLTRARNAGVGAIVAVGENLGDARKNVEPANLSISIQTIAQIKNVPVEAVMEAVSENTRRLYGVW